MAYSALAIATIRTKIYSNLYEHLATDSTYRITNYGNVHPSYNDKQTLEEGYPQVIISDIVISEAKITLGRRGLYKVPYSVMIHVHHSSAANSRTVADEVHSKFRGDGRNVLRNYGFRRINWESDDYERIPYNPKKSVHIYHLNLTGTFVSEV